MNKEISHVLKERIKRNGGLKFVNVLAGMVQTVTKQDVNADGNTVTNKFPVSYDVEMQDCTKSPEKAVIPNGFEKGILYFEDGGSVFDGYESNGAIKYKSTLILVCWINRIKSVGEKYKEVTAYCVTDIISKLEAEKLKNEGDFQRIRVTPKKILVQDANVFSRYTYKEEVTQYLRPPYEFFGIQLEVSFAVHPSCITSINFENEKQC